MAESIDTLRQQILQLRELHATGVLSKSNFDENHANLERRLVDRVLAGGAGAAPGAARGGGKLRSFWLVGLVTGLALLAAGGSWWTARPQSGGAKLARMPVAAATAAGAASAAAQGKEPHATHTDQIAAMTDKLSERLKTQPDDSEGWAMLARSYSVLGKHAQALPAYKKALALRQSDPTLIADYADSLAKNTGGSLQGEPMKQVEAALKLDPRNLKALSLAGAEAIERKDYAAAVRFWEKLAQYGPAQDVIVQQVTPQLASARELAGTPRKAGAVVAN